MLFAHRWKDKITCFHFQLRKIVFSFLNFAADFPGSATVGTWLYNLVSWLRGQ